MALGERGELGFVQNIFAAVIPTATIVLAWISRGGRFNVILTGAAMLGGLFLGQQSFRRAWSECLDRGQEVAIAVTKHRNETGDYPPRLEQVYDDVPCECIVRDTILHYLSNDRAYRLWITDERSTWTFTASGRSASRSPTPPPRTR